MIKMVLDYTCLGMRIAKRRKNKGIKQNVLAERIGISNNYLSGIECGNEHPSLEIIIKICNELEVTPDYLLLGSMHSNQVSQNILDGLRLCTQEDIALISAIVSYLIERQGEKWKRDNFI